MYKLLLTSVFQFLQLLGIKIIKYCFFKTTVSHELPVVR